ncbi:dihydroorotate oxidase B electron transfer subunit [Sinobaca qinghaiensis]|uniref:Dihydroorotate dehydrogenase B (NAD(+)), electron transfer subunit n=1 Tax=Sinobaca qinghaiensis TaxID=342944 RepID=A0A419V644_9BACL|nr:dihydroorotate dehydrogenase electron transfer subunit [Sinobaca qinghaiensis]RKD75429.1 dihydroorotate oxidase B electron transfer subunit [Sinobaca qinghaiensis]
MIKENMRVEAQREIAPAIYEITLFGELVTHVSAPGQFLHIKPAPGTEFTLRRPLSISHVNEADKTLTVIYRADGQGTKRISEKRPGDVINVFGPLGNGFSTSSIQSGDQVLIVGGGVGIPPLYGLAKDILKKGASVTTVLGFADASAVFYKDVFEAQGPLFISTMDGSEGTKGVVTDVIREQGLSFDYLYACGPNPMLRALNKDYSEARGAVSLEERMGCGIGACFACVCHPVDDPTGTGYRKICSDGPVFNWGEVII